jgi:hypothetical protein
LVVRIGESWTGSPASLIIVAIISSALNSISRVAVYQYAATGQAPAAFDAQMAQAAFGARGRRAS